MFVSNYPFKAERCYTFYSSLILQLPYSIHFYSRIALNWIFKIIKFWYLRPTPDRKPLQSLNRFAPEWFSFRSHVIYTGHLTLNGKLTENTVVMPRSFSIFKLSEEKKAKKSWILKSKSIPKTSSKIKVDY